MSATPLLEDMLHVSLLVRDTARAVGFYHGVLGLPLCARPELGFPGAWLAVGARQIHLLELPSPDPAEGRPAHGGRDRHVAFAVSDIPRLEVALQRAGVPFTRSRSGRVALFCRDPDGNALEFVQS